MENTLLNTVSQTSLFEDFGYVNVYCESPRKGYGIMLFPNLFEEGTPALKNTHY